MCRAWCFDTYTGRCLFTITWAKSVLFCSMSLFMVIALARGWLYMGIQAAEVSNTV